MSHCGQYHIFFCDPMMKGKFIMLRLLFIFPHHKVEEHKRLKKNILQKHIFYLYLVSGSIALMDGFRLKEIQYSAKMNNIYLKRIVI